MSAACFVFSNNYFCSTHPDRFSHSNPPPLNLPIHGNANTQNNNGPALAHLPDNRLHPRTMSTIHPEPSGTGSAGRKRKSGDTNIPIPKKLPRNSGEDALSVNARRKAAEERTANLIWTIDAAASTPETMTEADISCPTAKGSLRCYAHELWYHTCGTNSELPPSTQPGDRAYTSHAPCEILLKCKWVINTMRVEQLLHAFGNL
ncbi:hypothetical protein RSOLAG22IIIB_06407 [Rhizoctonia solani]|uniref:Uncharacterized protein n=1 Tax=Rhizoctonia solani TaxID=456999 RepID=A0A0K6GEC3_9AGAM|nr:hypothetical protein RSOLAG22IIIB_06407 [Rhizoctonia solani]